MEVGGRAVITPRADCASWKERELKGGMQPQPQGPAINMHGPSTSHRLAPPCSLH